MVRPYIGFPNGKGATACCGAAEIAGQQTQEVVRIVAVMFFSAKEDCPRPQPRL